VILLTQERRQELLNIEAGLTDHPFPPQLVIETTSRCNMKCLHCSHKEMKRPRQDMTEELFKRIVEEIAREKADCEIWPTFYGEALLLGDTLWRWLDYAASIGCRNIVLNSNGILLDRNIDQVLASPLRRFILSLDGFKPETFKKIRVGGSRNKIYAAVEKLLRRREELGQKYPIIQCQYSVMAENEAEVPEFTEFWRARGAEVKVRHMFSWTSTGSIRVPGLENEPDFRIACPWGMNAAAIHQNGNLVTCAVDYEGGFVAGNVAEKGIKEIWQGAHKARVRDLHRQHKWHEIPVICQTCPDWQVVGAKYVGPEGKTAFSRPFWHAETEPDAHHDQ
jgi:radical SAM protein with 4Fe4S-binding SPASM domain